MAHFLNSSCALDVDDVDDAARNAVPIGLLFTAGTTGAAGGETLGFAAFDTDPGSAGVLVLPPAPTVVQGAPVEFCD